MYLNVSKEELKELIKESVREALMEIILSDPDEGLQLREEIKEYLLNSYKLLEEGKLPLISEEEAKKALEIE
ncbi:MAG: hypothetical protein DRQ24_11640 [Candidatus Latescibacterota bacterium]|nr:MAG: hypothetical protein DRQ24_11640 [Candidatus Latescibacterota bacterium]